MNNPHPTTASEWPAATTVAEAKAALAAVGGALDADNYPLPPALPGLRVYFDREAGEFRHPFLVWSLRTPGRKFFVYNRRSKKRDRRHTLYRIDYNREARTSRPSRARFLSILNETVAVIHGDSQA